MMLLNGNTETRTRSSTDCQVLPCGCACTPTMWLQMCDEHGLECAQLHESARAAYTREPEWLSL